MPSDPIEQILEVIIAHPKLYQEHGDKRILNFLRKEKQFLTEKKRLLRSTEEIDCTKVKTYLEEYRTFHSIIDTAKDLPIWIFEKEGGEGIEMDGNRVVVAVNRVRMDDALMSELIQSIQSKIAEFLLQYSLKPNIPEAIRELELLFDRIISNLKILQRGIQQIIESASGRPMIMPDKADIVALEEQYKVISDLLDRFEVFVQSLFLPLLADTKESPARLLEGEGLQEAQARLREMMDNTLEIQRLAEVAKKS